MSNARRDSLRKRLGEVNREWRILYKSEKTEVTRRRMKLLKDLRIELVIEIVDLATEDRSNLVA